jgi:hypothetical protein
MAVGGGAPADDVDHEVFARLNRFNVSENLVINMIWAGRCGLAGRSVTERRKRRTMISTETSRRQSEPNSHSLNVIGDHK